MTTRMDANHSSNTMLITLLGGAIIGGLMVALTTPKTGREVRNTLRNTANRLRGKSEEPDELDTGTIDALFI